MNIKLTSFSHGAGCGCKISPAILDTILKRNITFPDQEKLLVGNDSKDDAAAYDLGDGRALISTTDFFMPIVDDAFDFGRIASANAISDVYAMGGTPILAIAILGWPINKIGPDVANEVIRGAREICNAAGITLAGGHSIDSPEPIFGLAVSGIVAIEQLKRNSTAQSGDHLFLTKKLGIGVISTAQKKGLVKLEDTILASESMVHLNSVGIKLGGCRGVNSMTDVTGFGLLGHLTEMCEGSGLSAVVYKENIQYLTKNLSAYIDLGAVPGGTVRNLDSYGHKINMSHIDQRIQYMLADPQTSGGLLVSVSASSIHEVESILRDHNLEDHITPIGKMVDRQEWLVDIE
ncbi:MAG: selenide, water dikinase SelD [bacterium]